MPVFATPRPISLTLELGAGTVHLRASDRADTVVEVHATDPDDEIAVQVARAARVEFGDGKLVVVMAHAGDPVLGLKQDLLDGIAGGPAGHGVLGRVLRHLVGPATVELSIELQLPSGSNVRGTMTAGELHCTGRLGDTHLRTADADIRLEETGALHATTTSGEIHVGRAEGATELVTRDGEIHVGVIDGAATIDNTNGEVEVGEVTGNLRLIDVNGEISIGRALGNVDGRSAHGGIRIGEVVHGTVTLVTGGGELEVGIARGTAAFLDVDTAGGEIHSDLESVSGPSASDETVELRARTGGGNIWIHRSRHGAAPEAVHPPVSD